MARQKLGKRKCKWCKVEFQKIQPIQPYCSMDCAINLSKEHIKKKREKAEKEEMEKLKKGLLTHSDWLGMLQVKINFIARTIDTNFPCISSRRTTGKWNGGHYYTVGAHPNLRFHLFNIYKQSFSDNHFKSANITAYTFNLFRLFGSDFVNNEILTLDQKYPVTKLSIPEIQVAIEKCKVIIKDQKQGKWIAQTTQDRISIRVELNKQIGIYNERS